MFLLFSNDHGKEIELWDPEEPREARPTIDIIFNYIEP